MKNFLTNNIGLKILSIVVGALLWLIIININDPVVVETFTNIPVKPINDDIVTSTGFQYNIVSGNKTDIKVKGKRSIVDNLKESEFVAEADFGTMSNELYLATITAYYKGYDGTDLEITPKTEAMVIKLEDKDTQTFNIRVEQKGSEREGYFVSDVELSSNILQVAGAVTQVSKIKEVVLEIDVNNKSESFEINAKPVAYDVDGNVVDPMKISYDQELIEAKVTIFPTKEIKLNVTLKGEPAYGYQASDPSFAPRSITIAGERTALNKILKLSVEYDITGMTETTEETISLEDILKTQYDGLYTLVSKDSASLVVVVPIEKLQVKEFYLQPPDISIKNLAEGLQASISTVSRTLSVMGKAEIVENLTIKDIKPYVDMKGYTAGTYTVDIETDYDSDITIQSSKATLRLTKKEIE